MRKPWTDTVQTSLLAILKNIEEEDVYMRQKMLRECKQYELYWHGFQMIFWDERSNDYRIPTHDVIEQLSTREETKYVYDYVVNIFKAHGLSIIAALSTEVPGVAFSPIDADSAADKLAAKKAESLGKVIQKYNKAKVLFYHALFTLFTNHFVASYNCYIRDKKYGTLEIPKYKNEKEEDSYKCNTCEYSQTEAGECPYCSNKLTFVEGQENIVEDGATEHIKGMENIQVFGTLNVKIPSYATDQDACGYLIQYSDQHYGWLRNAYRDTVDREKIGPSTSSGSDNFERIARMPSIGRVYSDSYLSSLVTLKRVWIRPWMYDTLDEVSANELHENYPDGVYFAVIDASAGLLAEVRKENLDDHWTIQKGDLSRSVHGDPLGKPLLPLQDLENMVTNLLTESLEHSVPSTFADPEILDFENYSSQEVLPGAVYPVKNTLTGQRNLDDYFFTLQTSTLPKEGVDFDSIVESKSQFVVGAFPSIFGGPASGGSKTLGEYQESRNYALQRLSIPYQLLFFWWSDTIHKSVLDHISNMIGDEKYSTKTSNGHFSTVMFLIEDFQKGRFTNLLAESATDLPVSFSEKRSTVQAIIQLNNEYLNGFLFSPNNLNVTLKYLGMEELSDLDADQVSKQLIEIDELLSSEPIPDQKNQVNIPSIPIEPEVDNDEIHLRILKTYLVSANGQEMKKLNPAGYTNCLLHAKAHQDNMNLVMIQQQTLNQPQQPPVGNTGSISGEE